MLLPKIFDFTIIPVSTFDLAGTKSFIILNKELSKNFNSLTNDFGDLVYAKVSSHAQEPEFQYCCMSCHSIGLANTSFLTSSNVGYPSSYLLLGSPIYSSISKLLDIFLIICSLTPCEISNATSTLCKSSEYFLFSCSIETYLERVLPET